MWNVRPSDTVPVVYDKDTNEPLGIALHNERATPWVEIPTCRNAGSTIDDFDIATNPNVDLLGNPDKHIVDAGGNIFGAEYIRIGHNPKLTNDEIVFLTKKKWQIPCLMSVGVSISQRVLWFEQAIELVGVDKDGNIITSGATTSITLPASIVVASANIIPITFTNHGLITGQRVVLSGNTRHELNVGPTYVTVVDQNNITLTGNFTIATGTYAATGILEVVDFVGWAKDAVGYVYESATATNAQDVIKTNGSSPMFAGTGGRTWTTTSSTPISTAPMTDSFNVASEDKILLTDNFVQFGTVAVDSSSANTYVPRSWIVPSPKFVRVRMRLKSHKNAGSIIGKITNIAKSGSAVATVTMTKSPSCPTLKINDTVQIYGVRDQTNFANTTAATPIASIVSQDANTVVFTISFGASATSSNTDGGIVCMVNGGVLHPIPNFAVQSVVRSGWYLSLTLNAAVSGFTIGETIYFAGANAAMAGLEGWYKVVLQNVPVNTLVLKWLGDQSWTITSTNTGGALYRTIDLRIHFVTCIQYTRQYIENILLGSDQNKSQPVLITNGLTISSGTVNVQGANAQWSTTLVNPILHESRTTNRAVSGDAQMSRSIVDKYGKQITAYTIRDLVIQRDPVTISSTTETTISAAIASVFQDLLQLVITNTSATAVRVDIRDATAGTVKFPIQMAAWETKVLHFPHPIKQSAVNTNWTA